MRESGQDLSATLAIEAGGARAQLQGSIPRRADQDARALALVRWGLAGVRASAQPLALESAKLLKLSTENG